jgi:hypothetical protein
MGFLSTRSGVWPFGTLSPSIGLATQGDSSGLCETNDARRGHSISCSLVKTSMNFSSVIPDSLGIGFGHGFVE